MSCFPLPWGSPTAPFAEMATYYDATELSTALKPFFLQYLLAEGDDVVMYLDPDIEVFASLDDLFALGDRVPIVLSPHVTQPMHATVSTPVRKRSSSAGSSTWGSSS